MKHRIIPVRMTGNMRIRVDRLLYCHDEGGWSEAVLDLLAKAEREGLIDVCVITEDAFEARLRISVYRDVETRLDFGTDEASFFTKIPDCAAALEDLDERVRKAAQRAADAVQDLVREIKEAQSLARKPL